MIRKIRHGLRAAHKKEEGVTGLETAIILIAFVIVASVFAFVVLSTGLFSAERGKQTVIAGLEKASGNVELRGSVTLMDVNTDGAMTAVGLDTVVFNLAAAAAGRPNLLDPAATTNNIVMNMVDSTAREANVTYTVDWISGDGDDLLEVGELAEVTVVLPGTMALATNEEWVLEVLPPAGGSLLISRIMPPQIDAVMDMK